MSAAQDREDYVKAMIAGRLSVCVAIEKRYDLYGYSPELVCIGLSAAVDGIDPETAISEYTGAPS